MNNNYLDLLAYFGIGGAHPGGFSLTKHLLNDVVLNEHSLVLDAGCGTGQTAAFLSETYGCSVTAIDLHPLMIKKAKERFKKQNLPISLVQGDIQNLPFSDHTFDFLLAESVISFTDVSQTLSELARVLKKNGCMIIVEMTAKKPLSPSVQKKVHSLYGIKQVLTEEAWKLELQKAGFSHIMPTSPSPNLAPSEIMDINPSSSIRSDLHELWDAHESFVTQQDTPLSYCIFHCSFASSP